MATPVTLVDQNGQPFTSFTLSSEADINIGDVGLLGDDGAVVAGSKSDTVWDGSAGSPTWTALWKYIAAKAEAIRALLASGITIAAAQTIATITTVTTVTTVAAVTAITNALPAGTNLIGRTAADASAATGGIPSTARLLSAAGTSGDATNVKNTAGRLYSIQGANVATSARYLKLYNSASAPTAGSGTPVKTLYLPPSSAFVFDWPLGLTFSAGIGFTLVTGSADNSSTSVTAADILALNLDYA